MRLLIGVACLLLGCASTPAPRALPRSRLPGTDGTLHTLPGNAAPALTVIVFFSAHCDCQAAHDARLRELARHYAARGVAFYAVDAERDASLERDRDEASRRAYPFPILVDRGAALARALAADYATYTVVFDARGMIRYRGGIDSDLVHLRADANFYLRDALDDLLAGHAPRREYGEALGCGLQIE